MASAPFKFNWFNENGVSDRGTGSSIQFRRPLGVHGTWRNRDFGLHSSPACLQVGFSCAIRTMSLRMFSGSRARPARDFQNNLKP
jgi:hypothetical protein